MLSVRVLGAASAAIVLDILFVLMLVQLDLADIYQENSLIEFVQMLVLGAGVAACAWRRHGELAVFDRRLFTALGLLALAILYRESDVQALLSPGSVAREALLLARSVLGPLLWLAAAFALAQALLADRRLAVRLLGSELALLFAACVALMVFAALLDKSVLKLAGPNRFYEELLELNAYVALLAAAFAGTSAPDLRRFVPGAPLRKHPSS